MTEKCSHHQSKRRKLFQRICIGILIFLFIVLIIGLIFALVLHYRKPRFVLQDATVFNLNTTVPNVVTATFQITVLSHNPNDKIGVYYSNLDTYATYHSQQITLYTAIPPTYQGHKEVIIWSPFLSGIEVPIAPYNGISLGQDRSYGVVNIVFKMHGRVRFKVGTYTSGHYHLDVRCPATIPLDNNSNGIVVGNAIKYQLQQRCSVSI